MIVVYGLALADVPDDASLSGGAAPLRGVRCGPLVAIVTDHPEPPPRTTASVTRHAVVVAEVTGRLPAAPVRFGVWYREEDGLRSALAEREAELVGIVEHVAGAVEVVVREGTDGEPVATTGAAPHVTDVVPEPAPTGTGPGTAYLTARLAETRKQRERRQDSRQRLLDATARLVPHARAHRLVDGRHGLERCFLVDRASAERVVEMAASIATEHGLVVGGPWSPFTFADADAP